MKGTPRLLRVLRAEHDLTQMKLARSARLNLTRYWQIENGEGLPPTQAEQRSIASALGVTIADIAWPAFATVKAS